MVNDDAISLSLCVATRSTPVSPAECGMLEIFMFGFPDAEQIRFCGEEDIIVVLTIVIAAGVRSPRLVNLDWLAV